MRAARETGLFDTVPLEPSEQGFEIRRYRRLRPVLDFACATFLLVLMAPVIAVACLLVRLTSRGSALYTQRRMGRGGKVFSIFKIRTMYEDSEPNGPVWSVSGDARVTPVGRFLRWAHLDELPQLFNVLRGDMGLIGPRPERPEIVARIEDCLPNYRDRLQLRPGLTGLAQVLQGPDASLDDVRRKLKFDLYYLEHRSLWLDLKICLATPLHLLHVPAPIIASLFGFPHEGRVSVETGLDREISKVSSRVQPDYVS